MSAKQTSIKHNFIFQSFYQMLSIVLPMITAPYISRVLGAEGIGVYSYTFSVASYFALFAKLGIHVYGNRCIASVRDDQTKLNTIFSELLLVHVGVGILTFLMYLFYIFGFTRDNITIVAVQSLYIIAEIIEIDWLFFGLERFKITVLRSAFIKLFIVICIFLLVKSDADTWKYCTILAVGTLLNEAFIWIHASKYVRIVAPNIKNALSHIKPLVTFFIPSLAVSFYKVMDKIMLGYMKGPIQVGLYENSERIIILSLGIVTALETVMMPRITNLISNGEVKESNRLMGISLSLIMPITIGATFGIIGVSQTFPVVFFGRDFFECDNLLIGLAISMPFTAFASVIRTQFLIPNNFDFVYQISVISGAIVNIVVNYLLIAKFYAMGAVVGTICAEVAVCFIQVIFASKHIDVARYILWVIPYCGVGSIMSLITFLLGKLLGTSFFSLFIQVIVGFLLYSVLATIIMRLTNKEACMIISSLNNTTRTRLSNK